MAERDLAPEPTHTTSQGEAMLAGLSGFWRSADRQMSWSQKATRRFAYRVAALCPAVSARVITTATAPYWSVPVAQPNSAVLHVN